MKKLNIVERAFLRLWGFLLLVIPFLPLEMLFGTFKGVLLPFTPVQWLLGTASICLLSLLLLWLPPARLQRMAEVCSARVLSGLADTRPFLVLGLLALLIFLSSHFGFHHRPHLIDSIVQLFQANIFAAGLLKAPLPPSAGFFMTQHMIFDIDGWFAQYPPLHSLLLAIGSLVSFPWLSQWLLALGTAFLLYRLCDDIYDRETALCCLLISCVCGFFLFMSASHMNHVSTLFFISALLYCFRKWETTNSSAAAACCGLALGSAFLIRPLTALAFGIPCALFGIRHFMRDKPLRSTLAGILSFSAFAPLLLAYNYLSNRDPFLTGYIRLWGKGHDLGFHTSPWGDSHTPLMGLRNELIDLALLNETLFESPIPGLLPLALFLCFSKRLLRWDLRFALCFFAVPMSYFFYWHRDNFLGSRFLYEALACILPLTARALVSGVSELRSLQFGSERFFRPINAGSFAATALFLCLLYILSIGIPQRFTVLASSLSSMKRSITREARAAGIGRALVFVKVSWGNRLLARLRAAGVSASLAEQAYRFADHCKLYEVLLRYEHEPSQLIVATEELLQRQEILLPVQATIHLNRDPTLRLAANSRLSAACVEELQYDQTAYTVYLGALAENTPSLDGDFVIARDLREQNRTLAAHYAKYPHYRYDGASFLELDTSWR